MVTTSNMGLIAWNLSSDPYDSEELAGNWLKVDQHDHTPGKGVAIGTAALEDESITAEKIAPGALDVFSVPDASITTPKLADNSVTTSKIVDGSVTASKLASGITLPVGTLSAWAGDSGSVPSGWLLCNGAAVSRTVTYSALFAVVGTSYGTGDGSTTFNLPDLRGRIPVGLGTNAAVDSRSDNEALAVGSRTPLHVHADGSLAVASHAHDMANHRHQHVYPLLQVAVNHYEYAVHGSGSAFLNDLDSHVDSLDTLGPSSNNRRSLIANTVTATESLDRFGVTSGKPVDNTGAASNNTGSTAPDVTGSTGSAGVPYVVVNYLIRY